MATIGVNTALWTVDWSDPAASRELLGRIAELDFDAVQIPILGTGALDPDWLAPMIRDAGLRCYISAGLGPDTDVTSEHSSVRRAGVDYLRYCVETASRMGCNFLSGSFHSVFGMKATGPVTRAHWERSADALKVVAQVAADAGLLIALEPINRYESFLINSGAQAIELIEMIGEPNLRVQLDTFHMNLEEESIAAAIKESGSRMIHFHVAENHRGRFGHGSMAWDEVFGALAKINYPGAIVIESFVPEVTRVATAASIWRAMAESANALAAEGVIFLRALAARYDLREQAD